METADEPNANAPSFDDRDSTSPPSKPSLRIASRRIAVLEVGAILFLILGPTFASLGSSVFWGTEYRKFKSDRRFIDDQTETTVDIVLFNDTATALGLVPILLFVIWRSREPWSRFGLVAPKYPKDLLLGLGLWLIVAALGGLISVAFGRHEPWFQFTRATAPQTRVLILVGWSCAVGFSEELIFRAYLIPRLETILRSTWKSVAISVLLFAFVHFYQGYIGVLHRIATACIFGWAFCATRRIWPVAIAHAIVDFIVGIHAEPIGG